MGGLLVVVSVGMDVAIGILPALANADKAAGFVQSVGTPPDLVAGNEFDGGVVRVGFFMVPDLQAQPFCRWVVRKLQFCRPEIRMPGGHQIGFPSKDEGRLAGAEQRCGPWADRG